MYDYWQKSAFFIKIDAVQQLFYLKCKHDILGIHLIPCLSNRNQKAKKSHFVILKYFDLEKADFYQWLLKMLFVTTAHIAHGYQGVTAYLKALIVSFGVVYNL